MAAANFEHFACEAGGVPVCHGESTARLENACEFGSDELGARGEHRTEHRNNDVEGRVGIGELLGIAFIEPGGEIFQGGLFASLGEKLGAMSTPVTTAP